MRLLDRYLLRELLVPFFYCLMAFLIFWISFDLFAAIDEFQKNRLSGLDILEYYLVKTPELLVLVLPITLLLALLYALTNHSRHHELTAIRAAGVSLGRLAAPYFLVGLLLSLATFAMNERWVPQSAELADQILSRYEPEDSSLGPGTWHRGVGLFNEREQRGWWVEAFNFDTHEMVRPHVFRMLPDGGRRDTTAERAARQDGAWVFTNVQEFIYPPGQGAVPTPTETNELVMMELAETPEEIKSEIKLSKVKDLRTARRAQLSVREIQNYLRLHPDARPDRTAMLETKLHGRLAAPWTCLVVVLIALPFGAAPGRRNVFVGVASSIFICFAYLVLQQVALAVGTRGTIPPWLAGWAPNLLFAVAGLTLAWRVR